MLASRMSQSHSQLRFPPNLVELRLDGHFRAPLHNVSFPSSLRILHFGSGSNNHSLAASAWDPPEDLEELDLGDAWNRPCTQLHLPPRLRKLKFSDKFNQPIANERGECILILPDILTELRFGCGFRQSLRFLRLPPSLRFLSILTYYGDDDDDSDSGSAPGPPTLSDLPLHLPPCLRCLELDNESYFQAAWARHPQWPTRCAVKYMDGWVE